MILYLRHYKNQISDDAIIAISISPITFSYRVEHKEKGKFYEDDISPFVIPGPENE